MDLNRNNSATLVEARVIVETVDNVEMGKTFTLPIVQWFKHEFFSSVFFKFIIAGGVAAMINFFSRIGLSLFLNYAMAIIIAYLIGMLTAFILNRLFVFDSRQGHTAHQFFYFTLVNLFAILQTLVVSLLLARWVLPTMGIEHGMEEIAHLFGICVPVFTSFLGHKYFSFRK